MSDRFERVLSYVYSRRWLVAALMALSHLCVAVSVAAYGYLLYYHLMTSLTVLCVFAAVTAIPFFAVTLLRRVINSPRPYEVSRLFEIPPKDTRGRSFPSRHVYSAFSVLVPFFAVNLELGVGFLVIALLMSAARVLLGYHFIRDVVAGLLMGLISGGLCILTLYML